MIGAYRALIARRDPARGRRTAEEHSVWQPITIGPQQAPDPSYMGGAYGEIRSRPAMLRSMVFFHPYESENLAEAFVLGINLEYQNRARPPRGRHTPWQERANIDIPQHVAYGSLFTSATPTYGYN